MSRIYDALKHTENDVVRMIESETEQRGQPVPAAVDSDGARQVIETPPPVEVPDTGGVATAYSPEPAEPFNDRGYRIAKIRARASQPVLPFDGSDRRTAECYRILRTNILQHAAKPKVIAVSSPGAGDGKTTTAINIAGVLALKQDVRVLLVDGDLRRSTIAPKLGIEDAPGLAEVLTGQCSLQDAVVQTENLPNLHILPAGRTIANPAELLDSAAWRDLTGYLRKQFTFAIVDSTPMGIVADYDLIHAVCDGTILVMRPDHTERQACAKALKAIARNKLLGVVLNCAGDWFLWKMRDYYGYYPESK
ncbi:MAG: hypothetical protein PGMFKBFP_01736 [Anaerolineales bacterium]|nr:hypothetical protein [Anaerolineales bacterium]